MSLQTSIMWSKSTRAARGFIGAVIKSNSQSSKTFASSSTVFHQTNTNNGVLHTIPLVIIRHGQSTWNQQNIFIGMTDTPLTEDGVKEARNAGKLLLSDERLSKIDIVYTSLLRRSTKTVWHVMEEIGREWTPVIKDFRLNERSYGALVGRNKKHCVEEYGADQVKKWRRSWDVPPPPMSTSSEYWPGKEARYSEMGMDLSKIPLSESLKDVTVRTSHFWDEVIVPQLKLKRRVLIVGHENNLRSIIKRLDNISNEDILHIELPRAIPIVFELDPITLKPIKMENSAKGLSGRYICNSDVLERIHHRDQQQVYDLSIKTSLEKIGVPLYGESTITTPSQKSGYINSEAVNSSSKVSS